MYRKTSMTQVPSQARAKRYASERTKKKKNPYKKRVRPMKKGY
jgi:hypothetical protein